MSLMISSERPFDNRGDASYPAVLSEMASRARSWNGPIVIATHVDPDGDALGSSLALLRALRQLGKRTLAVAEPPEYLEFLIEEGEVQPELPEMEEGTLLFVLDSAAESRVAGVEITQASATFNIDHHGTNDRFGDLAVVEPSKAACALLVKELIDALGVRFTPEIATPCLTGILTDTGHFRFGNTSREAMEVAGELIDKGVDYAALTDRLQWRQRGYFQLLGEVMRTVAFHLGGRLVTAAVTTEARERVGAKEDDSEDFVGIIRYAEGALVAALLKERGDEVRVSMRARGGVSAQRICIELGGGGHIAAAGATLSGPLDAAMQRVVSSVARELERHETLHEDRPGGASRGRRASDA